MNGIQIKNNLIYYYGNKAGYLDQGKAVVDPIFENRELSEYLTGRKGFELEWKNGIFSRLAMGNTDPEGNLKILRKCRIHQLKPETDIFMKFIGYQELTEKFGEPDPENYRIVYDGEVETNELEELCTMFYPDHPPGYEGHILSMSDVIELYDDTGSSFYYVDRSGFPEILFETQELEPYQGPSMNL